MKVGGSFWLPVAKGLGSRDVRNQSRSRPLESGLGPKDKELAGPGLKNKTLPGPKNKTLPGLNRDPEKLKAPGLVPGPMEKGITGTEPGPGLKILGPAHL